MTYEEALRFRAPAAMLRDANRILDGEARRLLEQELEAEAAVGHGANPAQGAGMKQAGANEVHRGGL